MSHAMHLCNLFKSKCMVFILCSSVIPLKLYNPAVTNILNYCKTNRNGPFIDTNSSSVADFPALLTFPST